MMVELILVEGVSDVQLISYYLQNVYGWKYEKDNVLGITALDGYEHIESLSKDGNKIILCGVGGIGKFAHFVSDHRINDMIIERDISSVIVVTDRDEASDAKIKRKVKDSFAAISFNVAEWKTNTIIDSFKLSKKVNTYLLVIPENENGALERVIINALNDIPEEKDLIQEVIDFIDSLKQELVPDLNQINKSNKATVGTFFSVRNPQNAMRAFSIIISKIDWSKSESLKKLFMPFAYLGKEKPIS